MAYAQEMKNLVADIKTSHRDRTKYVKDVKNDTHELIARFQGELKEMARDLKDFLAKSEATRKRDFDAFYKAIQARVRNVKEDTAKLMQGIRARIKDIKGDTADLLAQFDKEMKELAADLKEFLGKSEADRTAAFKAMMQDINSDIDDIRKNIKALLGDYRGERKEAARYWADLGSRVVTEEASVEEAPALVEEVPAPEAKKKKRKGQK